MRRMTLLEASQTGDPLDFVRELTNLTLSAEWTTFSRESAICHLFMLGVKCEESRQICFKILGENHDGDSKKLMSQLQTMQTYPTQEGKVKEINNTVFCPNCHIRGYAKMDCWGQCGTCKGWGHKQIYCRQGQGNKKKKKIEKQKAAKKKAAKAKRAQEATDDLPSDEFEDDSSDDNSSPE